MDFILPTKGLSRNSGAVHPDIDEEMRADTLRTMAFLAPLAEEPV